MSKVSELERLYEKPGKRQFTRLAYAVAERLECREVGLFWGGGGDSRLGVELGFDVLAVDNDRSLAGVMAEDGATFGYRTFAGNARQVREERDFWHADFMGTPTPDNGHTIAHLAKRARRVLAVTLATDHIRNPEMMGESLRVTLPAWLMDHADGFTLDYFGSYRRNSGGLRMWTAILVRRDGRHTFALHPHQIKYALRDRGYWASHDLYESGLLVHRQTLRSERTRQGDRKRYLRKHPPGASRNIKCRRCLVPFIWEAKPGRPPTMCESCRPLAMKEYRATLYWNDADAARKRASTYRAAHRNGPLTHVCDVCRQPYTTFRPNQRFCSAECRKSGRYVDERIRLTGGGPKLTPCSCEECGSAFTAVGRQSHRFCGPDCIASFKRRAARLRYRIRKAAVSGTAAEAVNREVAA